MPAPSLLIFAMNEKSKSKEFDFDVIIIGAGMGGISAGYYAGQKLKYSYAIFEARNEVGGTWSSFTYPGVRNDSDMFTYSFPFNPWNRSDAIAEGKDILDYIQSTAKKFDIDKNIHFGHTATSFAWSSEKKRWTSTFIAPEHQTVVVTSRFLMIATGCINHDKAHYPDLPGRIIFKGPILHAQFWPKDLDYENKTVIVIGSGATAISMVPHMARKAKHVTMIQRSPTYITTRNKVDRATDWIIKLLPFRLAFAIVFFMYEIDRMVFFFFCKLFPSIGRHCLQTHVKKQLPYTIPLQPHFIPTFKPFEQALCWTVENDLFARMREGKASIFTGTINQLTEEGIEMNDGQHIQGDIIVQATGFQCRFLGGIKMTIDDQEMRLGETFFYRGMMLDGVPNAIVLLGFIHASWTIGIIQACDFFSNLLIKMKIQGYQTVTPIADPDVQKSQKPFPLTSGFILRVLHLIPKTSDGLIWRHHLDPIVDWLEIRLNKRYRNLEFE